MSNHAGQTGFYVDFEEVRLLGTLFKAQNDKPKPTAIILHGIPGIEKNYDIALALREIGWNAVIFHYRGCWGSSGSYQVTSIPQDVNAVIKYLTSGVYPVIDPEKVILIGHSLGGWAAILAASGNTAIKAVASISPITVNTRFPLADTAYAAGYTPWLGKTTPEELATQWRDLGSAYSPLEQAHKIAPRPFLVIHSKADQEVPIFHTNALKDVIGDKAEFIQHSKANHSFTWNRKWLLKHILDWLNKTKV